jgi:hypothetical protein
MLSICPTCGVDAPARIVVGQDVVKHTYCPIHGESTAIIESDPNFFYYIQQNWSPTIYDGVLIDVTKRCNASCKYCFQTKDDSPDPSIDAIVSQTLRVSDRYPVILSGGEPTLRTDLGEIVCAIAERNPVTVLTNGFGINWGLSCAWVLSHHPETKTLFDAAIVDAIEAEKKFLSIIFTVDDEASLLKAVEAGLALRAVSESFRIHVAAPVGADCKKPKNAMFVSDMLNILVGKWKVLAGKGKLNYLPIRINGVDFRLISWANKHTIVLDDLACPPYYIVDGRMEHLVTTLVRQEFAA